MPHFEGVLARPHVRDLKRAVCICQDIVGMRGNDQYCLHPSMHIALHLDDFRRIYFISIFFLNFGWAMLKEVLEPGSVLMLWSTSSSFIISSVDPAGTIWACG